MYFAAGFGAFFGGLGADVDGPGLDGLEDWLLRRKRLIFAFSTAILQSWDFSASSRATTSSASVSAVSVLSLSSTGITGRLVAPGVLECGIVARFSASEAKVFASVRVMGDYRITSSRMLGRSLVVQEVRTAENESNKATLKESQLSISTSVARLMLQV